MAWRNDHDLLRLQNSVYDLLRMVGGGDGQGQKEFYVSIALEWNPKRWEELPLHGRPVVVFICSLGYLRCSKFSTIYMYYSIIKKLP